MLTRRKLIEQLYCALQVLEMYFSVDFSGIYWYLHWYFDHCCRYRYVFVEYLIQVC